MFDCNYEHGLQFLLQIFGNGKIIYIHTDIVEWDDGDSAGHNHISKRNIWKCSRISAR